MHFEPQSIGPPDTIPEPLPVLATRRPTETSKGGATWVSPKVTPTYRFSGRATHVSACSSSPGSQPNTQVTSSPGTAAIAVRVTAVPAGQRRRAVDLVRRSPDAVDRVLGVGDPTLALDQHLERCRREQRPDLWRLDPGTQLDRAGRLRAALGRAPLVKVLIRSRVGGQLHGERRGAWGRGCLDGVDDFTFSVVVVVRAPRLDASLDLPCRVEQDGSGRHGGHTQRHLDGCRLRPCGPRRSRRRQGEDHEQREHGEHPAPEARSIACRSRIAITRPHHWGAPSRVFAACPSIPLGFRGFNVRPESPLSAAASASRRFLRTLSSALDACLIGAGDNSWIKRSKE